MKHVLEIYNDVERKEFNNSFDVSNINNKNFMPLEIFNNNFWKIEYCTLSPNELMEFGEFIIKIVNGYKRKEYYFDILPMTSMKIPQFFDIKSFGNVIKSKNYNSLVDFIDLFFLLFKEKTETYVTLYIEYMEFYEFLNNLQQFTINYIKYPIFYNKELNHHLTEKYLNELESFAYFNLKYGEAGYTGIWKKIKN
jgi:hypothetical protein